MSVLPKVHSSVTEQFHRVLITLELGMPDVLCCMDSTTELPPTVVRACHEGRRALGALTLVMTNLVNRRTDGRFRLPDAFGSGVDNRVPQLLPALHWATASL